MRLELERLGSPYLSRRIARVVYDNVIPARYEEFSVRDLIRIGSAVMSLRDTTSSIKIYPENDKLVIETPRYKVKVSSGDLVCLEPEEELKNYWVFNLLRKILGYTAALGFVAAVYDKLDVNDVVKKDSESKVRSEESAA
jgi:hypothetical protein